MASKIIRKTPIIRPTLPTLDDFVQVVADSYNSGSITLGKVVAQFEEEVSRLTGARCAVAVSSCTSGLMLAFAAQEFKEGSEVVVPSFTFAATVQALLWNRLTPVFVDCLPGTMTMDPGQVLNAIGRRTAAICPVNVFGLPPDITPLTLISERFGIPMIFDSAQGLGSTYQSTPAGTFGLCEVFSLSPTKVVTSVEGGVITTNDEPLAAKLRLMRDYGKGPDGQEIVFNGLSARMSELHATVGLLSLRNIEVLIRRRMELIHKYREITGVLPGCAMQEFPHDRTSSGNYFTLLIGDRPTDRDKVYEALRANHIQTKKYFYPPVHSQKFMLRYPYRVAGDLKWTWSSSLRSLALPLYSHMTDSQHDHVCDVLKNVLSDGHSKKTNESS